MKRLHLLVLAFGLVGVVTPGSATILTFDIVPPVDYTQVINYGSNMTALCTGSGQPGCVLEGNAFTPNVAVSFRSLLSLGNGTLDVPYTYFWDTGYGDLTNVTFAYKYGDYAEVTLTPQNGTSVKLNSFDLAGYFTADIAGQSVRVFNADYTAILYSFDGTIASAGPTHSAFSGLNIVSNGPIHIQFGPDWNVAIDNLNFDQINATDTSFQVSYAANLNIGESNIDITNTGANGAPAAGPGFGGTTGNICVNVYAVDPGEELISCCSCMITPDATANLGVVRDLTSNTQTGAAVTSVTVKLYGTLPVAGAAAGSVTCNNSAAGGAYAGAAIANGLAAWDTTLHAAPLGTYATTERRFTPATLSPDELASLQGRCAGIIGNASGFGVCASCRAGALGAAKLTQ